jgi:hypothetical protein
MKWLLIGFIAVAVTFGMIGLAEATPFTTNLVNDIHDSTPDSIPTPWGDNNRDIYQAINRLLGTGYTANEQIDSRFVEPDYIWQQLDGDIAAIGLTAGNTQRLGYYTDLGVGSVKTGLLGPHSGFTWLGDGTNSNPYPAAAIGLPTGTLFGWYLNSSGTNFYSESGLNADTYDHMVTYDLSDLAGTTIYVDKGSGDVTHTFTSDAFLIAWEDLNGLGDEDFDDYMVIVDKTAPIPEPGTLLLLGVGLAGLVGYGLSRRKKKT